MRMHFRKVIKLTCYIHIVRFIDIHEAWRNVQTHIEVISHIKIKISAIIETTIGIIRIHTITRITPKVFYQAILSKISRRNKISQFLRTTWDINIYVLLKCHFLKNLIIPIDIRMPIRISMISESDHIVFSIREIRQSTIIRMCFLY